MINDRLTRIEANHLELVYGPASTEVAAAISAETNGLHQLETGASVRGLHIHAVDAEW